MYSHNMVIFINPSALFCHLFHLYILSILYKIQYWKTSFIIVSLVDPIFINITLRTKTILRKTPKISLPLISNCGICLIIYLKQEKNLNGLFLYRYPAHIKQHNQDDLSTPTQWNWQWLYVTGIVIQFGVNICYWYFQRHLHSEKSRSTTW